MGADRLDKAIRGGAKVGGFILAANLVDVMARLVYSRPKQNARAAWQEFVEKYLPRYGGLADLLYEGFRGAISHNYSLKGIRLTDGPEYVHRHWQVEGGDRVLHLETFVAELREAFDKLYTNLQADSALRTRVLGRTRVHPPLGIVAGTTADLPASAALNSARLAALSAATSWAGAHAASGAAYSHLPGFRFEPVREQSPAAANPRKKRRKKGR